MAEARGEIVAGRFSVSNIANGWYRSGEGFREAGKQCILPRLKIDASGWGVRQSEEIDLR